MKLPRPTYAVQVVHPGMSVSQYDSSGNVSIKVPPGYEAYGQQFANDVNSGVDIAQALRRVGQSLTAAGYDARAVLKQVGELNAQLVSMASLMGQDLPGITSEL